jgi:molybdenum cofactor biosynthesis enzyme MoaA
MFKKLTRFMKGSPETAKRDRRWLRVYLDTNWSCNISCRICLHSIIDHGPIRHGSMSLELFAKIARDVFPITQHLSLSCSAEPLMSGIFVDVLKSIGEYNVPFVEFITNATLLNERNIDAIISSGVDLMLVSVDSADREVFEKIRLGAKFEKVISNLEKFQKAKRERGAAKPALRFSAVLMRSTIEGIEDLMRLAHRLDAEGIHFRHFIPYAPLYLKEESLFYHKELANEHIFRARALAGKLNFKNVSPAGCLLRRRESAGNDDKLPTSLGGDIHTRQRQCSALRIATFHRYGKPGGAIV